VIFKPLLFVTLAMLTAVGQERPGGAAQSVPIPRAGNLEISGLGGFNFGGSLSSVNATAANQGATPVEVVSPSSNGAIGLQAAASVTNRLLITTEWAYIPGGRMSLNQDYVLPENPPRTRRISVNGRASSMDMNAGVSYLFPLARVLQTIPYVLAGGGAIQSTGDVQTASIGDKPGQTFSGRSRTYHRAVYGGSGLRYYFGERTGFRVEMRAYRAREVGAFGRLVFGVFYQFR
jgi:hypothetical protein